MVRENRLELRLSDAELEALLGAALFYEMPAARLAREAALAVAAGRVVPAEWLELSVTGLEEAAARLRGVAGFEPPGWDSEEGVS